MEGKRGGKRTLLSLMCPPLWRHAARRQKLQGWPQVVKAKISTGANVFSCHSGDTHQPNPLSPLWHPRHIAVGFNRQDMWLYTN